MGKTHLESSEATNGKICSNTKYNLNQIVEKANEHPDWLPDGWNVDLRTRKSGAHMGAGYKCYIDPLTGCKFYSKPEVLRYLDTIKGNSCSSEKGKKSTSVHSPSNVVEKSTVDDLPPGWIKEVKIRKSSNGIRKDPYYTDSASGFVFRSKKDALRYLESGDISKCVFKPDKRQIQDEDKLTPSSAAKRQKLKQSATKRQLFVGKEISDKSNIELLDANSSKKGQDVKVSVGMMVAPVPAIETVVKMHMLEDAAANPPEMNRSEPADVQENYVLNVMENADENNHSSPSLSENKKGLNVPHRFSRRLARIEPDQVANSMTNEQALQVPKRSLRKRRTTLDDDLANKSSQQFNVVPEIEHLHKISGGLPNKSSKLSENRDNKQEQHQYSPFQDSSSPGLKVAMKTTGDLPVLDNPHAGHGLASEAYVLKENKLNAGEIGKTGAQEFRANSSKSNNKKDHRIPCRASKRLAGFEPEITNSINCDKAPEYKCRKSKGEVKEELWQSEHVPAVELAGHASTYINAPRNGEASNRSRKSPKIPTPTNERLEKLGDEQLYDEKSEPHLSFAFHYSWSDPCLEFAIKTLTGALPVEDSVDNGSVLVPETDMFQKNKSLNVTEGSSDKNPQVTSKKSKNKKGLSLPRRLSKRLAGHEPEVVPAERALEYATRKSCKDEPIATKNLSNGASKHLDDGEETELTLHASDCLKRGGHGESSNKSEKSYEAQIVPKEQLGKLEADNFDERSGPQLSVPFGDSWSDPCLEFAIKTLTGALPVDAASDILPVMTPDVNDPPNKGLLESVVEKSINEEAHDNSNQSQNNEEIDMVCQPSKQILRQPELTISTTSCENTPNEGLLESVVEKRVNEEAHDNLIQSQNNEEIDMVCQPSKQILGQHELMISSTSCENAPKFATRESYGDEANITRNLNEGESLHIESIDMVCQPSKQLVGQPELRTSSTSCKNSPKFITQESYGDEASITRNLNEGESLYIESINMVCQPPKQLLGQPKLRISSISCENSPKFTTKESYGDEANLTRNLYGESLHIDGESLHIEGTDMVRQPSKQLLGKPELRTSSTSSENYPKLATKESCGDEANLSQSLYGESLHIEAIDMVCQPLKLLGQPELRTSSTSCENATDEAKTRNVDGESLHIETGKLTQLPHQCINIDKLMMEEPSKKFERVLGGESIPVEQPQFETQSQFCAPFMDSWSDPCLEFAFKTLTGAIPVEENLAIQGCFQEPANRRGQRDGGSKFPDFGAPSFSQSDISSNCNVEKSMLGQQSSMSSSFIPPEKLSLHCCAGFDSQKHYSECNKNFQGR